MPPNISTGNELGTAILRALGQPTDFVTEVKLVCKANGLAKLTIRRFVDGTYLTQELKRYKLTEIDDAD
jgi:hypothetical protein